MRRLLLFILCGFALAALATPARSDQTGPPQTKDRLPPEKMEKLVAGPLGAVEKSGLPEAELAFDRLLQEARRRQGSASVLEADLLMSFGVTLFERGSELQREDMRQISAVYLGRAVAATKRAFGPVHPETALALHTYADVLVDLERGDPRDDAEAALAEALSIRQATLGPDNSEALAAMRSLARAKAARFRIAGKLDEAAALFRQALAISTRTRPSEPYLQPDSLRGQLIGAYVGAGRRDEALREARIAAREVAVEGDPCGFDEAEIKVIVADLEAGRPPETKPPPNPPPTSSACQDWLKKGGRAPR